ncbi:MAG: hypothetical protein AABY15_06575 [Nanoarchaeota archaeon]
MEKKFTQVCVWEGCLVGKEKIDEFKAHMKKEFGVRVKYIEEIKTQPDSNGPGGRNDLLFYIHVDDIGKFAVKRLLFGIRWFEDVVKNSPRIYSNETIAKYKTW